MTQTKGVDGTFRKIDRHDIALGNITFHVIVFILQFANRHDVPVFSEIPISGRSQKGLSRRHIPNGARYHLQHNSLDLGTSTGLALYSAELCTSNDFPRNYRNQPLTAWVRSVRKPVMV